MKRPGLPAGPAQRPRRQGNPRPDRAQAQAPGAGPMPPPAAGPPPATVLAPVPGLVTGVQDALQAIAAYLVLYPGAADNALGIAQWWLPALHTQQPLAQVQAALQLLQQQGLVVAQPLPDGQLVYGLRPGGSDGG